MIKTDLISVDSVSGSINLGLFSSVGNYLVYLQAISKFGTILTLDNPVLNLTVSMPPVVPPNHNPFFNVSSFLMRANFSNPKEADSIHLELPEILDANHNDTHTISIEPVEEYLEIN